MTSCECFINLLQSKKKQLIVWEWKKQDLTLNFNLLKMYQARPGTQLHIFKGAFSKSSYQLM